jgi:hypothetical protein
VEKLLVNARQALRPPRPDHPAPDPVPCCGVFGVVAVCGPVSVPAGGQAVIETSVPTGAMDRGGRMQGLSDVVTRVQARNCSTMIRSSSEWSGSNSSCTAAERSCRIDTDSI